MSNPYVIFAGDSKNHLEPRKAAPTEESAIIKWPRSFKRSGTV